MHLTLRSRIGVLAGCLIALCHVAAATNAGTLPADIAGRIDTTEARRILNYLAADELGGRNTPSQGLDAAATFLIDELRSAGVEPVNGSYVHNYILERVNLDTPAVLSITRQGAVYDAKAKTDFVPFEQTGEGDVTSDRVVFAGFGVTAPEYKYDDYAGIDVRGAVVVVMRAEPQHPTDSVWFNGKGYTRHSSLNEKVRNASKHGAAALLVIDGTRTMKRLSVSGFPWPSLFPTMTIDALPLTLPNDGRRTMPVLHVGDTVLTQLVGPLQDVLSRIARIDSTMQPGSVVLDNRQVRISLRLRKDTVRVRNIVGMVRGSERPDEYVVMGAHYDHIGMSKDKNVKDSVYNGADDNGSGTAGLLMTAKAFATSSFKPTRSMLFIHFSGEEKGLLGSKAYVRDPVLPLDKCVAMINMDMIGRCELNKLSIGGNLRCPDLTKINEEENAQRERPYTLAYDIEQYFFRSDQASFAMKRIPVLFYFTGEHADYHKLSDEVHKINFADLVGITKLAASTAWRAAAMPRTRYLPAGFED